MKHLLFTILLATLCSCGSETTSTAEPDPIIPDPIVPEQGKRLVGGDLSLVPAYERVGQPWYDQNGKAIPDLITYLRDEAGWNAVRVRLMVDPSQDNDPSTCQDLAYVTALGRRVKEAGMTFLLDFFYSDTWADPEQQWIPRSWHADRNTATATLATQLRTYTQQTLDALCQAGAQPDYVQIGNEVSYGMLWDDITGKSFDNAFWLDPLWFTYDRQESGKKAQKGAIDRFASLLNAAAQGVRQSQAAKARIILHIERSGEKAWAGNFYQWVGMAGFQDYDVIGLSYYPFWHGNLKALESTVNFLHATYPDKEIQVVETAWNYQYGPEEAVCKDWPYTKAGQAMYLKDLTSTLSTLPVSGLYYWCPEENGNGPSHSVMNGWLNRGLWDNATHRLNATEILQTFKKWAE